MAEPLKDLYNPVFFEEIIPVMKDVLPHMDERDFIFNVFDREWPDLALKMRVRKIACAMKAVLHSDFSKAAAEICDLAGAFRERKMRVQGFEMIFLPEFVGLFGEKHLKDSLDALEQVTTLVSAEFAIRIFLLAYPAETLRRMEVWSRHHNQNVRRLASEGCRPRLPWAIGVPWLKRHPEKILPILENLKEDPSEYVRRSVANNLNDIAKDHPEFVLQVAEKWSDENPLTKKLIRHGCRTLLRKGDVRSHRLHGLDPDSRFSIVSFGLSSDTVNLGGHLAFELVLKNCETKMGRFRVDYVIDYVTPTGKISTRVFTLLEREIPSGDQITAGWKKVFRDFSIRKQCEGIHRIHIHVNGRRAVSKSFFVTA